MYIKFDRPTEIDFQDFIKYWAALYTYNPKHTMGNKLYDATILKQEFSVEDIHALFRWKNGMPLSGNKTETVNLITQNIELINRLKCLGHKDILSELDFIRDGVWKIFLLHIIRPKIYPIFDQHTYRAYQYIKNDMILEIPKDKKSMMSCYLDEYIPFIRKKLLDTDSDEHQRLKVREIDKAFFTFGQFLKSPFVNMIGTTVDTEFIERTMSSVYSKNINGTYDYSPPLKEYLSKNPQKIQDAINLFNKRDYFLQGKYYEKRWEMGHYLMDQFGIEFEQSEGSELIFSLCLAIMQEFSLSEAKVGNLLKVSLSKQYVK